MYEYKYEVDKKCPDCGKTFKGKSQRIQRCPECMDKFVKGIEDKEEATKDMLNDRWRNL